MPTWAMSRSSVDTFGPARSTGDARSSSPNGRMPLRPLMDALLSTAEAEFMLGLDAAALLSRAASIEGRIVGRPPFWSLLASVGNALGAQLMWSGDLVGGRRTLERTYRDLVDRGHYTILWETLALLSELESRAGAFGPALEYAEELVEITVEAGYDQARDLGLWARALAETHLGLVEPARRDATEGLALAEQHGDLLPRDHEPLRPRIPRALTGRAPSVEPIPGAAPRPARPQGHRRARRVPVRARLRRGARRPAAASNAPRRRWSPSNTGASSSTGRSPWPPRPVAEGSSPLWRTR